MSADYQVQAIYSDLDSGMNRDKQGALKVVTDATSVEQSIDTILLTPLGSRVFLRDFGSRLHELVFEPSTIETTLRIRNEIERAITTWDPRLVIISVNVEIMESDGVSIPSGADNNQLLVTIEGYIQGLNNFSYSKVLTRD